MLINFKVARIAIILIAFLAIIAFMTVRYARDGRNDQPYIDLTLALEIELADVLPTVAFSPDGKMLAYINSHDTLSVMNLEDLEVRELQGGGIWGVLAFSPNDGSIAAPLGDKIIFYNPKTGDQLYALEGSTEHIHSLDFSPDGKMVAYRDLNYIYLREIATGTLKDKIPSKGASLSFSPKGSLLAYTDYDEKTRRGGGASVVLWDVETKKPVEKIYDARGMSFSPDGSLLAVRIGTAVRLWDVESERMLRQKVEWKNLGNADCLGFSMDGRMLASGGNDSRKEGWLTGIVSRLKHPREALSGIVVLSDAQTGKRLWIWREDYSGHVSSLDFSPDGEMLAVGLQNIKSKVMLWEINKLDSNGNDE